jgi:thioesterase domain-containing protein
MNHQEFEKYLFKNIPVTRAFGIKITAFDDEQVSLKAEFKKNINHRSSVFGGSISNLLILAAWGRMIRVCDKIDRRANIVIKNSQVDFLRPIFEDFEAVCSHIPGEELEPFHESFKRQGKGRLTIYSNIMINANVMATFKGDFVGVGKKKTESK